MQAALLQEQIAYYRARAGEYDQWFLREGHYDHGPELNAAEPSTNEPAGTGGPSDYGC